ncbi:hypothetical protein BGZ99_006797 [Dissophora globulifera]|uniref:Uncharacterized protein n=1 Tax=Dissophora globulifera TaxID=979702 RepID=A0A9P6RWU7_9FUNG|nr:hypothetical protein BGZ99_006797 [Dissophora globulifera]
MDIDGQESAHARSESTPALTPMQVLAGQASSSSGVPARRATKRRRVSNPPIPTLRQDQPATTGSSSMPAYPPRPSIPRAESLPSTNASTVQAPTQTESQASEAQRGGSRGGGSERENLMDLETSSTSIAPSEPQYTRKRGKYRRRDGWETYFASRKTASSFRPKPRPDLRAKARRSVSATPSLLMSPTPVAEDTVAHVRSAAAGSMGTPRDVGQAEQGSTLTGLEGSRQTVREDEDSNAGSESEAPNDLLEDIWLADPPAMERPFLQEAFPYDSYQAPHDRIPTSSLDTLQLPLSQEWHRPQGRMAQEDFFSKEKLNYALEISKKIPVNSRGLRMDVYYYRGFELAARRMLDRVRTQNWAQDKEKAEENEKEKPVGDEEEVRSVRKLPVLSADPPRMFKYPAAPRLSGQAAEQENLMDEDEDDEEEADELAEDADDTPGETNTPLSSTVLAATTTSATSLNMPSLSTTASTVDLVNGGSNPASLSSTSTSTPNPSKKRYHKETEALLPRSVVEFDKERRIDLTSTPTLADYYQVNAYLTMLFKPIMRRRPIPLSPAASRILQTVMMGLEAKVVGMGCHLQRRELTDRLAQADARSRFSKLTTYRKPKPFDVDNYVLQPSFDLSKDIEGESRPFVSNPLQIPEQLEPFSVARDFLEKKHQQK